MVEARAARGRCCDYAHCATAAVLALRFGDGRMRGPGGSRRLQPFAFYCVEHARIVRNDFLTCQERPLYAWERLRVAST